MFFYNFHIYFELQSPLVHCTRGADHCARLPTAVSWGNCFQLYTGHHFFPLSQSWLCRVPMSPGAVQSPEKTLNILVPQFLDLWSCIGYLSFLSLSFFIWKTMTMIPASGLLSVYSEMVYNNIVPGEMEALRKVSCCCHYHHYHQD